MIFSLYKWLLDKMYRRIFQWWIIIIFYWKANNFIHSIRNMHHHIFYSNQFAHRQLTKMKMREIESKCWMLNAEWTIENMKMFVHLFCYYVSMLLFFFQLFRQWTKKYQKVCAFYNAWAFKIWNTKKTVVIKTLTSNLAQFNIQCFCCRIFRTSSTERKSFHHFIFAFVQYPAESGRDQ